MLEIPFTLMMNIALGKSTLPRSRLSLICCFLMFGEKHQLIQYKHIFESWGRIDEYQSLKERADHDKARINEKFSNISETVAIVKVIINNIEVQNLRLIAKQDKIYDMIYDQIKATKK